MSELEFHGHGALKPCGKISLRLKSLGCSEGLRFSAVTRKVRGTLEELHLWGAYCDTTIMLGVLILLPHLILPVECFIIPISQMRTQAQRGYRS